MTEKEFKKLKPGDKVKIVSERVVGMNVMGYMDKWLGKVMTVKERSVGGDIHMIEDQNEYLDGWYWDENMIECKMPEVGKMIRILTRGGKTIAKYGKKAGIARCSTVDKYDEAKGAIIAVARLYGYDVVSDKTGKVTLASEERRRSDEALDKLAAGIFGKPLKETAKDRVKRELKELSERRNSLSRALQGASKKLPESMKVEGEAFNLLEMQLRVMEMYEAILARRLAIWKD